MSARVALRVRLAARAPGLVHRYRAGMRFGVEPREVVVDAAQAWALHGDPCLQVEQLEHGITPEQHESDSATLLFKPAPTTLPKPKKSKVNASKPVHAGLQAGGGV